jgi:glycosyltransferase involved in cell wall biosynthesis
VVKITICSFGKTLKKKAVKFMKYIIHYDINKNEGRNYVLAATNKADYIIHTLNDNGIDVDIISASLTSIKRYVKGSKTKINNNTTLTKLPAFKWGNKFQKLIAYIWQNISLLFYLIFMTKKDEQIIAYHSLSTMLPIRLAKQIKKFKLILETEEIYSDVIGDNKKRIKELKFFKLADKYIFPTSMLNDLVNTENKPYTIIHGTYEVEKERNVSFNDDKIHVVYAGTFDPRKGGATAATAAEFLPQNYHIHILGFGTEHDTKLIKNIINDTNAKHGATVTYDGLLSGEDYIQFLQKCQIGLSPQNPDADFNATSFPSKILSYMANGLKVVTIRIPAIESSAIGDSMYYYDTQTPQKIAEAILTANSSIAHNEIKTIKQLDENFNIEIIKLLGEKSICPK